MGGQSIPTNADLYTRFFHITNEIADHLPDYLLERYEPLTEIDGAYFFSNNKGAIAVFSINETNGPNVLYFKDTNLKSTILVDAFKKALKRFEDAYSSTH